MTTDINVALREAEMRGILRAKAILDEYCDAHVRDEKLAGFAAVDAMSDLLERLAAEAKTPEDDSNARRNVEARPSPDFEGFIAALRQEIAWSHELHPGLRAGDGQAESDRDSLARLAHSVEMVGRRLGFLAAPPPATPKPA